MSLTQDRGISNSYQSRDPGLNKHKYGFWIALLLRSFL